MWTCRVVAYLWAAWAIVDERPFWRGIVLPGVFLLTAGQVLSHTSPWRRRETQ